MRFKDTHDVVVISEADAAKIIEHARPRWKLAIRIIYLYGLRASELLSITSNNFRDGEFVLKRFKGGHLTRQAIHPSIRGHPHAFRHAAGRRWAKIGTPNEIQAMFGHKTMVMAMLYSRLSCDVALSRKFLG